VRFDAEAKSVGVARIRMRVQMGRENDAFEDVIPVRILVSPETVAAYDEAKPRAEERIEIPADVVPGFGFLRVDLSSTLIVSLAESAQYLVSIRTAAPSSAPPRPRADAHAISAKHSASQASTADAEAPREPPSTNCTSISAVTEGSPSGRATASRRLRI
jgi:hypothetical protein